MRLDYGPLYKETPEGIDKTKTEWVTSVDISGYYIDKIMNAHSPKGHHFTKMFAYKINPLMNSFAEQMEKHFDKPQEEASFDENKSETELRPNLLTDHETTMAFMKAIEGPGWLEDQPQGPNVRGSLEYVMNWLKTAEEHDFATTLYGWGGIDRYEVHSDGSVVFLKHFSQPKTLQRAENLNFPIENL